MQMLNKVMALYGGLPTVALCLTKAEALRDYGTNSHEKRVSRMVETLCRELGMAADSCGEIASAALLHDIGKFAIPLDLIQKTAPLTNEEVALLKTHSAKGHEILSTSSDAFLNLAAELSLAHHERYDGTGYPHGLKGEKVPLGARILTICDVYDALRQDRPYRRGIPHSKAIDIILMGDGRTCPEHFAPDVLAAFRGIVSKFKSICESGN
jgi:putative two-component system response regulator